MCIYANGHPQILLLCCHGRRVLSFQEGHQARLVACGKDMWGQRSGVSWQDFFVGSSNMMTSFKLITKG